MVTRTLTLAALVLAAGCATTPPAEFAQPPDAGVTAPITNTQLNAHRTHPGPPVLIVHPNGNHITGLPYPDSCPRQPGADPRLAPTECTPGSARDDITQDNIAATICSPTWSTSTIRPPTSETNRLKPIVMRADGVPTTHRSTTELDHQVPLELGGSNDATNLWAEPSDLPGKGYRNTKDQVENHLHTAVCTHQVTLAAAQWAIATNWVTAEAALGLPYR